MKSFPDSYIFKVHLEACEEGFSGLSTVVFIARKNISAREITQSLSDSILNEGMTDSVIFIGMGYALDVLRELKGGKWRISAGLSILRIPELLKFLYFSKDGDLLEFGSEKILLNVKLVEAIRRQGLTEIMRKRKGIIKTPDTYHFIKPSKKHSDHFIRVAECISCSQEVDFISCWLLKPIAEITNLRKIYCDTGSIIAVVSRALHLRDLFGSNTEGETPIIESFGSYEKLDEYPFQITNQHMCVISATTSENLAELLVSNTGIDGHSLYTLFALAMLKNSSRVFCDLRKDETHNPNGYSLLESDTAKECRHCKRGSIAIKISGDSFIPAPPNVEVYTIKESDAPIWLSDFINKTAGKSIIKCFWQPEDHETEDIYIDIETYLKDPEVESNFNDFLSKRIPLKTKYILHTGSKDDVKMAKLVQDFIFMQNGVKVSINNQSDISTLDITNNAHVLVVAAAVSTGSRLLSMARSLRGKILTWSSIIGISRMSSLLRLEDIRKNLEKEKNAGKQSISFFKTITLSDLTTNIPSSFNEEFNLLKHITSSHQLNNYGFSKTELSLLNQRLKLLSEQNISIKPESDFLYPSCSGGRLSLRNGYVFIDNKPNGLEISHSDVYFTIAAVLHNLRHGKEPKLYKAVNCKMLVAAKNFDRFNDGVIQACILRASHPLEIDYEFADDESKTMLEILRSLITTKDKDHGEALPEFLLSIALKRLRLSTADNQKLVDLLSNNPATPDSLLNAMYLTVLFKLKS